MGSRALVPLLLACWLTVAAAQADTTRCVLIMSSAATDDAYSTSLNCTGAHTVVLVAHASQAVNHSVSYRWNGKLVAQNSNTMKANNVRYLTYSNRASSLLAVAYHPTSPCNTGAANCTLEVRAQVDSLMLPTAATANRGPAYSGITFTNIGTLRIRDSLFDIVKNEVPYVNNSDTTPAPPADPVAPGDQTYLFDETYHEDLSAATVVCNSTNRWGMHVSVQRSLFMFSGDPLSLSDYDSYYGGQRSFPNAQLSGLMLTTTGDAGHYRTVNISDTTVTGHAASRGGGIYVPYCPRPRYYVPDWQLRPQTNIQIQRCTFRDNQAYFKGGAVYVGAQCNTVISKSSFDNNHIVDIEPYYHRVMDEFGYRGGAVYAFSPDDFSIMDSNFFNNTANPLFWNAILGMGGALHIDINHTFTPGSATETIVRPRILVSSCSFTNNTAYTGGAVSVDDVTYNLWWEGDSHLNITHCTFNGNRAHDGSGALHLSGPTEWAASGSYTFDAVVDACDFTNNAAGQNGAIFAEQLHSFILFNTTLRNNTAGSVGAVGIKLAYGAIIANTVFVANNATAGDAGALSMENSVLVVQSSLFVNNTAAYGSGGAIKASPGTLYASTTVFSGNSAGVSGGAIAIEQARGARPNPDLLQSSAYEQVAQLLANFSESDDRSADKLYSILEVMNPLQVTVQTYFTYFPARMTELANITAHVVMSYFTDNHAGGLGGAVLAQGTALVIDQATFNSNSGSAGGAVAVVDCVGAFNAYDTAFNNNSASGFGGAVAASSCNATFNNTLMDGNQGSAGGAVYSGLGLATSAAPGTIVLLLTDSNVSRNNATAGSGGGIMAVGVNVMLMGGVAGPGNYAAMMGGGVAVSGAELAVSGTTTSGNSAGGLQERTTYI